ncbi:MAG: tRNA (adenosine(37)-N6)-threonylcarbamoyltransferase complex transferase subunit TsaD [Clostridia bacterium]|nr:tRNA (adenosine(37)-N6)-threonylcarbamoyltransferase complex transferase subunit TsaD [Clostridia bacterium]
MKKDIIVLGIESSCDETAASVVKNGREVLSSIVNSQIDIHKQYGGVVPEIASRNHVQNIDVVVKEALDQAKVGIKDIDYVAVTYGAGLVGALLVGVSFAKAFCQANDIPLVKVNHIEGHICANYITHPDLEPPFTCLLASGGHTAIVDVQSYTDYTVLKTTIDDACGEAFDKVARTLGLCYPGGVQIDKLAQNGVADTEFKSVVLKDGNFSYSGLKTGVINYVHNLAQKGIQPDKNNLAKSFTVAAIKGVVDEAVKIADQSHKKLCVAGGVGANSYMREYATQQCDKRGIKIFLPQLKYCGDNAAMIASQGYFLAREGIDLAGLDLNACPTLTLKTKN